MAKSGKGGGKKGKKGPPPISKGFGSSVSVDQSKKEPEVLDLDTVSKISMYKLFVRATSATPWRPLGEIMVEDSSTVEAALKERRSVLRDAASQLPEMKAATKGKLDLIQYGIRLINLDADKEEKSDIEISQVAVGGAIKEEVKALMNINLGIGTKPAGSIWNRNQVLYGGVNRAEAMLAKARSLSMAASEPAAVNDAAEPKTGDV
eukprot:CAMPEP_0114255042 /NCGR_PEP_ID=MMETSP0058-20121206/17334_1 /TAXON_ID=36894 /ORGANISM="Pyramimonas parkeae, CCMP726" /LENGTH=205 /DNA_ID=CAMNT_0001369367 /DNA_START=257 /DNA_END=874 /DNA_ORIENTATION=+